VAQIGVLSGLVSSLCRFATVRSMWSRSLPACGDVYAMVGISLQIVRGMFTDRNTLVLTLYLVSEAAVLVLRVVRRSALDSSIYSVSAEASVLSRW
jgi:hypothetical protein